MKFLSSDYGYTFSWEQVVAGFFRKYNILQSKRILSEDVFHREVVGSKLITKRLISKKDSKAVAAMNKLLFFLHKPEFVYVVEESVVDVKNKTFTTYTRNIGKDHTEVIEKCLYTASHSPTSNNVQTQQKKWLWIESSHNRFANIIESAIYKVLTFKAKKSSSELNSALELLHLTRGDKLKDTAMKAGRFAHKSAKIVHPK